MRRVLWGAGLTASALWALGFGFFGLAVLLVVPPVGLFALAVAALPAASMGFLWLGRVAEGAGRAQAGPVAAGPAYARPMVDPAQLTRPVLERALLTALDLATPMVGPGAGGPWMPVDVTSPSPPAIRPIQADGSVVPILAEAGIVLAGPGPGQAVRHMIAAYPFAVADASLSAAQGNHLGAFGADVVAMERMPDAHLVGEVRTAIRVVAADGMVSHVVVWRRGPLIAHVSVSGDETLAGILLGHATQVADQRLTWLLG